MIGKRQFSYLSGMRTVTEKCLIVGESLLYRPCIIKANHSKMTASIETLQRSLDIINSKLTSGLPPDPADLSTVRSQLESLFSELQDECDGRAEHWEMVCESLAEVIPHYLCFNRFLFCFLENSSARKLLHEGEARKYYSGIAGNKSKIREKK